MGWGKAGKGERVQEIVEVSDWDLGRLIGKGGTILRELQTGTGCHIDVPREWASENETQLRSVAISGTHEQVSRARQAVDGVLMGETPKDILAQIDGAAILKNLDPASIAHLQKHSRCLEMQHDIALDFDVSSVRIWSNSGDAAAAMKGRCALEETIEEITTMCTESVSVPSDLIAVIINDSTLRQIQVQSGLTATVAKSDSGSAIRLTGLAGAVEEAKALIENLSTGKGSEFVSLGPGLLTRVTRQMAVNLERDLDHLRQNSGAIIEIQWDLNRLHINGPPDAAVFAKGELLQILCFYFPQECATVSVPLEAIGYIAGEDDRELFKLQSSAVVMSLDRDAGVMWLSGDAKVLDNVRSRLLGSLQRWQRCFAKLTAQHQWQCWAIIGKGGERIRTLQEKTGAQINVDGDRKEITITGSEEAVQQAKHEVELLLQAQGASNDSCRKSAGHSNNSSYSKSAQHDSGDGWRESESVGGLETGHNVWSESAAAAQLDENDEQNLCWSFKNGYCKRGDQCSWSHQLGTVGRGGHGCSRGRGRGSRW